MRKSSLVHRNAHLEVRRSGGSTVPHNLKKSKQLKLPLHLENLSFSNLDLRPPHKTTSNNVYRKFNFTHAEFSNIPGLVIISLEDRLVRINSSKNNVYSVFRKNVSSRNDHAKDYRYCILEVPKELQEVVTKQIWQSYYLEPINFSFSKMTHFLDNNQRVPKSIFKFNSPYEVDRNGKRVRTFTHFKNRPGIYLIKKKTKIVYIGMSENCIVERAYKHFIKLDPIANQGQVTYFKELLQNVPLSLAFIEFPRTYLKGGKRMPYSKEEVVALCKKYEKILITQLDPLDNKNGYLLSEEVSFTAEDVAILSKSGDAPPF